MKNMKLLRPTTFVASPLNKAYDDCENLAEEEAWYLAEDLEQEVKDEIENWLASQIFSLIEDCIQRRKR